MNRGKSVVFLIVPTVLLLSIGSAVAQEEQFTLAHKFRAGEIVRYQISSEGDGGRETLSQTGRHWMVTWHLSKTALLRHKVAGVAPDGTATVAHQIEKLTVTDTRAERSKKTELSASAAKLWVNGKATREGLDRLPKYKDLLLFGKPLTLKRKPTGQVTEFAGLTVKDLVTLGYNVPDLILVLEATSVVFPEHPIVVGETWEHRGMLPLPIVDPTRPVEAFTTYRLDKVEPKDGDRIAHISFSTSQDLSVIHPDLVILWMRWTAITCPLNITVERASAQAKGVIQWSLTRGLVTRSEFTLDYDLAIPATVGSENMQQWYTMKSKGYAFLKP